MHLKHIRINQLLNSEKISKENGFLLKFRNIFKGPSFYCQKILHHKTQLRCRNSQELKICLKKGGLFIRSFKKVVLSLKNGKSKKNSVFNGLLLVNQSFQ